MDEPIDDMQGLHLDEPINDLGDVDLFGDAVLPLSPSRHLLQRVDELRSRGCCKRIAWSKQGTIASITSNGEFINLQYLRASPRNGEWGLSEPTPCRLMGETLPGGPIVHLAWSPTPTPDLAIIDAFGRVCIMPVAVCLNRPFPMRKWDEDAADDLHAVVGCFWLPLPPKMNQYNVTYGPAVGTDNGIYEYKQTYGPSSQPWHPNPSKSALVCVTADGRVKFFYSQPNGKWQCVTLDLDSLATSDDVIGHAVVCADRQKLLLALATLGGQLKVISLGIDWGLPATEKQVPASSLVINPTLREALIATTSLSSGPNGHDMTDDAHIAHLEILGQTPDLPNKRMMPPVILVARIRVPSPTAAFGHDDQTTVDRWEILEQPQGVHPAFEQLGGRNTARNTPTKTIQIRQTGSLTSPKFLLSSFSLHLGRIIALAYSDGSVQYHDRITFAETCAEVNQSSFVMLREAGFVFDVEKPCLDLAMSPSTASLVTLGEDSKVRWVSMRYQNTDYGSSKKDPQYAAIVAGLTLTAASATLHGNMLDDIIATARPFAMSHPRFAQDWIMELVKAMKITADYSEEAAYEALVRDTNLVLALSMLQSLGMKGVVQPMTCTAKFSKMALSMRNIIILVTMASNPISSTIKEKISPLDDVDVVEAIAGCVAWTYELIAWIADCLFRLLEDTNFMAVLEPSRFDNLNTYLATENGVALQLLLSSSTRCFLSACCRRLMHQEDLSSRAVAHFEELTRQNTAEGGSDSHDSSATASQYRAWSKMHNTVTKCLVKTSEMEKLIASLTNDVREAYKMGLADAGQKHEEKLQRLNPKQREGQQKTEDYLKYARQILEVTMLLGGNAPPFFLPVLQKFFRVDLPKFRDGTNPAELFFGDYTLLEVDDTSAALAERRGKGIYVDTFRRSFLRASAKRRPRPATNGGAHRDSNEEPPVLPWRRCVRCSSVMEEVMPGIKATFSFVLSQQRKCACGGNWSSVAVDAIMS